MKLGGCGNDHIPLPSPHSIPDTVPDETELRLQLDRLLARGGRLGDPGRHSG